MRDFTTVKTPLKVTAQVLGSVEENTQRTMSASQITLFLGRAGRLLKTPLRHLLVRWLEPTVSSPKESVEIVHRVMFKELYPFPSSYSSVRNCKTAITVGGSGS